MPTGNPPCNAHAHLGSRHPRAPCAGGGSWDRLQLRVTPRGTRARSVTRDDPARKGLHRRSHQRDRPHPRLFDAGQFDLVVFGGMVPSDTKEHLREQISTRKPGATFVQGYAGIPGLVAEQVRPPSATAQSDPAPQSHTTASPGRSASPSTDHRASPSSPGGPPRSSPRNRKHLTSNSGRGTPHRRAHHRDPG